MENGFTKYSFIISMKFFSYLEWCMSEIFMLIICVKFGSILKNVIINLYTDYDKNNSLNSIITSGCNFQYQPY